MKGLMEKYLCFYGDTSLYMSLFVFIHYRNKLFSLFANINIITALWRDVIRTEGVQRVSLCVW